MKNFSDMLKQAQELQDKMAEMQEQLAEMEISGTAGGGMVSVTLNGKGEMQGLSIDKSLLAEDESEILEDLIVAAHNDAKGRLEEKMSEQMSDMTGGLPLPPGFKLPF